jgi:hypothetical protein
MSGNMRGLQKRLARVEQTLANIAKREKMANCICRDCTLVLPHEPEKFEAEMNRTCPVHGFRRLGQIMQVVFIGPDGVAEESAKLDELLEIYEARQPKKPRPSRLRKVSA